MSRIHFYVPRDLASKINDRAIKSGMSTSRYVAEIVKRDLASNWRRDSLKRSRGVGRVRPSTDPIRARSNRGTRWTDRDVSYRHQRLYPFSEPNIPAPCQSNAGISSRPRTLGDRQTRFPNVRFFRLKHCLAHNQLLRWAIDP